MMTTKELNEAIAEGKMFLMRKYKEGGEYGAPKLVSAEVAKHKSKVFVKSWDEFDNIEWHCPYSFELA